MHSKPFLTPRKTARASKPRPSPESRDSPIIIARQRETSLEGGVLHRGPHDAREETPDRTPKPNPLGGTPYRATSRCLFPPRNHTILDLFRPHADLTGGRPSKLRICQPRRQPRLPGRNPSMHRARTTIRSYPRVAYWSATSSRSE